MNNRFQLIKIIALFVVVYVAAYALWSVLNPYYQFVLAVAAQAILNWQIDFQFDSMMINEAGQTVLQLSSTVVHQVEGIGPFKPWLERTVESLDAVTFNAPLVLAMTITPIIYFQRWLHMRVLLEILLVIFLLHWTAFYLYALDRLLVNDFLQPLLQFYTLPPQKIVLPLEEFFLKYVMRFEPFLIGTYLWFRLNGEDGGLGISEKN